MKKQPRVRSAKDRDYGNKKDVMMADDDEDDFDFQFDEKDEQPTGGYYEEDDEPGDEALHSKSFVKKFFGFTNYTEAG